MSWLREKVGPTPAIVSLPSVSKYRYQSLRPDRENWVAVRQERILVSEFCKKGKKQCVRDRMPPMRIELISEDSCNWVVVIFGWYETSVLTVKLRGQGWCWERLCLLIFRTKKAAETIYKFSTIRSNRGKSESRQVHFPGRRKRVSDTVSVIDQIWSVLQKRTTLKIQKDKRDTWIDKHNP
jgi:hypothetical protein